MTAPLTKTPLVVGRAYRDRSGRRWHVVRITNAGRTGAAALPAMALASCMDADDSTRHPQWFCADTGRWAQDYRITTDIDLLRPA